MAVLSENSRANSQKARVGICELSAHDVEQGLALRVSGLGMRLPKGRGMSRLWGEHHWALRGIDLELRRGESIGILGRNGGGKSTLLRAIAGIIAVDEGTIAIAPDLSAAILSPGAGFENNLTGRENLYNSALYQGYLPRVVREKLDDIVELSGLGDWIDQPVAIYSAGMRARLGLSLALHLPSDVLMIDETLSAGDAAFRARAKQEIGALIASDRTVLLVSHDLDTLRNMCTKGIVLDQGRAIAVCDIAEAIKISKSILLSPASGTSGNSRLSQRANIEAQIEALQLELAAWREQATEHAQVLRFASQGYQVALESVIAVADKLVAAQRDETGGRAGSAPDRSGATSVMDVTSNVEAIVKAYHDAHQNMQGKKVEREAALAEQQRITRMGDDLRDQMSALRDKLAAL